MKQIAARGALYFKMTLTVIRAQLKAGNFAGVHHGIEATLTELTGPVEPEEELSRIQAYAAFSLLDTLIRTQGAEVALHTLDTLLEALNGLPAQTE